MSFLSCKVRYQLAILSSFFKSAAAAQLSQPPRPFVVTVILVAFQGRMEINEHFVRLNWMLLS